MSGTQNLVTRPALQSLTKVSKQKLVRTLAKIRVDNHDEMYVKM
jgi:hypothetical protein